MPGISGPIGIDLEGRRSMDPKKRVDWSEKGAVVQQLRLEFDLDFTEVAMIDDDALEIANAQQYCRTMFVENRNTFTSFR